MKTHHKNIGGTNTINSFCSTSESPSYKAVVWEVKILSHKYYLCENKVTKRLSIFMKSESEVVQLFPTLWDPMDCSLQGSSILVIFQARILEWVAFSFSRESSRPRDWTWVSHIASGRFYHLTHQGSIFMTWTKWILRLGVGKCGLIPLFLAPHLYSLSHQRCW